MGAVAATNTDNRTPTSVPMPEQPEELRRALRTIVLMALDAARQARARQAAEAQADAEFTNELDHEVGEAAS